MIHIPFSSKSEKNEPLRRCLEKTASATDLDVFMVAEVMSRFLEALADEVASNRAVQLPSFGLFAPWTWVPRKAGLAPYAVPGFYPAKGFRQEVAVRCPPDEAHTDRIVRYRKNHHNSSRNTRAASARVFTGQRAFRDRIRAQRRRAMGDEFD